MFLFSKPEDIPGIMNEKLPNVGFAVNQSPDGIPFGTYEGWRIVASPPDGVRLYAPEGGFELMRKFCQYMRGQRQMGPASYRPYLDGHLLYDSWEFLQADMSLLRNFLATHG